MSMVAQGWSLGTTSWDGPADKMEEWEPCTPGAQEEHKERCKRRALRVAAYEVRNCLRSCKLLCKNSARSLLTIAVFADCICLALLLFGNLSCPHVLQ